MRYRFLNLGNPLRGLTTKDPEYDDYLPVDDWTFLNAVRTVPLWLTMNDIADEAHSLSDCKASR